MGIHAVFCITILKLVDFARIPETLQQ